MILKLLGLYFTSATDLKYIRSVINALLQYFFKCVSIQIQLSQTLSSLPNLGRSKYLFIDTQSFQTPSIEHW